MSVAGPHSNQAGRKQTSESAKLSIGKIPNINQIWMKHHNCINAYVQLIHPESPLRKSSGMLLQESLQVLQSMLLDRNPCATSGSTSQEVGVRSGRSVMWRGFQEQTAPH